MLVLREDRPRPAEAGLARRSPGFQEKRWRKDWSRTRSGTAALIEAFAHPGDWQNAIALSTEGLDPLAKNEQPLCLLWQRIARDVPGSAEKTAALEKIGQPGLLL